MKKHTKNYGSCKSMLESVVVNIPKDNDNWDFILVIQKENDDQVFSEAAKEILTKLHDYGLQFSFFRPKRDDQKFIFAQTHCSDENLESEASRVQFPVLLDAKQLEKAAIKGFEEFNIAPFPLSKGGYPQYEYIYADYDDDIVDLPSFLAPPKCGFASKFTPVQRFKLIESIIKSAKLDLDESSGPVIAGFPLHDPQAIKELSKKWPRYCALPSNQPLDEIRQYFGERVAFYFGYLGHYTTWLMFASLAGAIVFAIQLSTKTEENLLFIHNKNGSSTSIRSEVPSIMTYTIPLFAFFMCIWSTLFMESWKRRQNALAMQWGMSNYAGDERHQFQDSEQQNTLGNSTIKHVSSFENMGRFLKSWAILIFLCGVVLALVGGIFYLHYVLTIEHPIEYKKGFLSHVPIGSVICSFANVAQIVVMGSIYTRVNHQLNNYENHKTDTQHENSLIIKSFIFQFINNFSGLFYVAFLKNTFEGDSQDRLHELAFSLAIVFGTQVIFGNIKEVLMPRFWLWYRNVSLKKLCSNCCGSYTAASTSDNDSIKSECAAHLEYDLAVYDSNGTFDDYHEIIIQFGFCTLFVVAFPLATVFSLLYTYFEIRIDALRLLYENRRPRPRNARDIGIWLDIVEFMTTLAIFTNAYIVVWTSNTLDFLEAKYHGRIYLIELYRNQAFMVFVSVLLAFRYLLAKLIPDVSGSVVTQLKRQEYLVSRAIYKVPDTNKVKAALISKPNDTNPAVAGPILTDTKSNAPSQDLDWTIYDNPQH